MRGQCELLTCTGGPNLPRTGWLAAAVGDTWTSTPAPVITSPVVGATFTSPDPAVAARHAIAAVSIFDPTINMDRSSVWVVRGAPDGTWTALHRLTNPSVPVDAYASRVAMSPAGGLAPDETSARVGGVQGKCCYQFAGPARRMGRPLCAVRAPWRCLAPG